MPRKLFVKGQSGNPGGVPKNPKNPKRKARLKVQEILEMENFDPFREMIELFKKTPKDRVRVDILIELCGYIAPKMKHIEISADDENPFIINLNLKPGNKRVEFNQVQDEVLNDENEESDQNDQSAEE